MAQCARFHQESLLLLLPRQAAAADILPLSLQEKKQQYRSRRARGPPRRRSPSRSNLGEGCREARRASDTESCSSKAAHARPLTAERSSCLLESGSNLANYLISATPSYGIRFGGCYSITFLYRNACLYLIRLVCGQVRSKNKHHKLNTQ